jgi:hypothetical protein
MMNAATITIARYIACRCVEDQIRAQGRKVREFAPKEIKALARDYLARHSELFDQARATLESHAQRKRR